MSVGTVPLTKEMCREKVREYECLYRKSRFEMDEIRAKIQSRLAHIDMLLIDLKREYDLCNSKIRRLNILVRVREAEAKIRKERYMVAELETGLVYKEIERDGNFEDMQAWRRTFIKFLDKEEKKKYQEDMEEGKEDKPLFPLSDDDLYNGKPLKVGSEKKDDEEEPEKVEPEKMDEKVLKDFEKKVDREMSEYIKKTKTSVTGQPLY